MTLVVVVGVLFAISNALPGDYHISRSKTIDAPPTDVMLRSWISTNGSLGTHGRNPIPTSRSQSKAIREKSGRFTSGQATSRSRGSMTLTAIDPNKRIHIHLEFDAPMKGTAESEFTFKPEKDSKDKTIVTWSMDGTSDSVHKVLRKPP